MDSIDEYDVRESFDAMDDEKLGCLTLDQFYTLYLGLGYPRATIEEVKAKIRAVQSDETITINTALQVLAKVRERLG